MNFKSNSLVSITALVVGVVILIYAGRHISDVVLFICGLAFVVPGLVSLIGLTLKSSIINHSAADRTIRFICGIAGLGLGVVVWCLPDVFRPLLIYLYGIMLIAGGIDQCVQLSRRSRAAGYPGWLIAGPLVILIAGVVLIVLDIFRRPVIEDNLGAEKWVMIATGIGAVIYGLNGLIILSYAYSQHRRDAKALKVSADTEPAPKSADTNTADTKAADIKASSAPSTESSHSDSTNS